MELRQEWIENRLKLAVSGRLDTTTAPELDKLLKETLDKAEELELDFSQLSYISSAGLRVLLSAQKVMGRKGKMVLKGVQEAVMEVFEITGFSDILSFE